MISRSDMLNSWNGVCEGMSVYSQDGEKLGRVAVMGEDSFVIEKGFFFPKDFSARYDDIVDVRDGTLYLAHDRDHYSDWKSDSYEGWNGVDAANDNRENNDEEQRVQLSEEKFEAHKQMNQFGEVKPRKIVHTEFRIERSDLIGKKIA